MSDAMEMDEQAMEILRGVQQEEILRVARMPVEKRLRVARAPACRILRILLITDFSEECDDEVAFELLVRMLRKLNTLGVECTVEVLVTDSPVRFAWFKHIFHQHFATGEWKWVKDDASPTPYQFVVDNVTVNFYCTVGPKQVKVPKILESASVPTDLPNHAAISQEDSLDYIIWNAAVPESVSPAWFENFHKKDGVVRVFQIGGDGSINSKPDWHFQAILRALGKGKEKQVLLLSATLTREVRLTRSFVKDLPPSLQDVVYAALVKFMAQRPELGEGVLKKYGGVKFLLRLNKANAAMDREWLEALGADAVPVLESTHEANAKQWARSYVARYCDKVGDASSVQRAELEEAVLVCVTIAMKLLGPEIWLDGAQDLAKLRDPGACVKTARQLELERLTPGYDCVSVLAMIRHILATWPWTGARGSAVPVWTELDLGPLRPHKAGDHVHTASDQPPSVAIRFTRDLERAFAPDIAATPGKESSIRPATALNSTVAPTRSSMD